MEIKKGMSLSDLLELSKHSEKHKKLFNGLALIDKTMQGMVKDILLNEIQDDVGEYFIKTEIMNQCYSLYIFNRTQQVTVGVSWPLADFLMLCAKQGLEIDLQIKVKRMLKKFTEKGLSTGSRTNWIY